MAFLFFTPPMTLEDIKPDNILLSSVEKPEIRFADFGLAKIYEANELGTPALPSHLRI